MKTIFAVIGLSIVMKAHAVNNQALKFIPGGEIVQEKLHEVKVKTPQGTIVEVEFNGDGSFEEASGDNLEKDIFVPDTGLVTLKDAVESIKKDGKSPVGDWELDRSFLSGWRYKFEGFEKGQKFDYYVDAKTGKLIKSELDD